MATSRLPSSPAAASHRTAFGNFSHPHRPWLSTTPSQLRGGLRKSAREGQLRLRLTRSTAGMTVFTLAVRRTDAAPPTRAMLPLHCLHPPQPFPILSLMTPPLPMTQSPGMCRGGMWTSGTTSWMKAPPRRRRRQSRDSSSRSAPRHGGRSPKRRREAPKGQGRRQKPGRGPGGSWSLPLTRRRPKRGRQRRKRRRNATVGAR